MDDSSSRSVFTLLRRSSRWLVVMVLVGAVAACDSGGTSEEQVTATTVRFQSDTLQIPGVVERLGEADAEDARPGVVIVHGSGPVNREGQVPRFNVPPVFARWARTMAESGVTVLRYDKRTTLSEARENPLGVTFLNYVDDAVAAARFLRDQPDVDPDSLFFVGHSQGAGVAMAAASRLDGQADVAALAGPAFAIDSLIVAQIRSNADASDSLANAVRSQFDTLRAQGATADGAIQGASDRFWRQWIRHTEKTDSVAAAHGGDVLVLQGRADDRYPGSALNRNLAAWEHVAASDADDVQIRTFENVNHFFPEPDRDGSPIRQFVAWIRR